MIQIAPSILSADFARLGEDLDAIESADMVHCDVMDGAFVPNISFGLPICQAVDRYTDMFLDVHLMIEKPVRYIEDFVRAGADLISVHLEADGPRGIAAAREYTNGVYLFRHLSFPPHIIYPFNLSYFNLFMASFQCSF